MNYMQKLAKEYPDVKFEHATGYKTAPNMTNYNIRSTKAAIWPVCLLAGGATKSNIIGYVAPFPILKFCRVSTPLHWVPNPLIRIFR